MYASSVNRNVTSRTNRWVCFSTRRKQNTRTFVLVEISNWLIFFCCTLCCTFAACDKQKATVCTLEARAGLIVKVISAIDFQPMAEGVTVTAIAPGFTEELRSIGEQREFVGLFERPGNYTVIVSKDGFIPFTKGDIEITKDECHVIPVTLQVFLNPD